MAAIRSWSFSSSSSIIEGLVDRLVAIGKPFDYMDYPNRDHSLREGEGTLVHVRIHI